MSDDIVKRLVRFDGRKCVSPDIEVEAADEIEKLREARDVVVALWSANEGAVAAEIEKLRKERDAAIEALRVAREALKECADDLNAELDYRHGSPPYMPDRFQRDMVPGRNSIVVG